MRRSLLSLIIGLGIFLCLSNNVFAQNQVRPQPYGQWLMYFGNNKFNDKWGLHSEAQFRNYLLPQTVQQTLLRVGINRYLNESSYITAGYAFIPTTPSTDNVEGFTTMEHRIWQQGILKNNYRNVFIEHRYRLEQRFIENKDTGVEKFDNRIRYRVQALVPLYVISPKWRHLFINSYNEIFMNFGRTVSGEIFDRNRLYFALGYQVSPKLNFQLGYLNQLISLPSTNSLDINHNLQIGISFNMDLVMPNSLFE